MKKAAAAAPPPASARLIQRVVSLSRLVRIALAALFALAVTLTLTPLIDRIYTDNFYSAETRMYPAVISTTLGLAYYLLGWRLIIGFVGETPPPRRAVLWYFCVGIAACLVAALLLVVGAVSGTLE